MCLLAYGMMLNKGCESEILQALYLSRFPQSALRGKKCSLLSVTKLLDQMRSTFSIGTQADCMVDTTGLVCLLDLVETPLSQHSFRSALARCFD